MDLDLFRQAGERLESWGRTLILTHARPDGDALGGIGAMQRIVRTAGREATAMIYEPVGARYAFLAEACELTTREPREPADIDNAFDGVLILDTCSWSQLEPVADYLRASSLPKIILDHHATRDDLSGTAGDDLYVIEPAAAAACDMIATWCSIMDWTIDEVAANALFAGVATDTGWFRFSNTNAEALDAAAALVELGARPDVLHSRFYATHSAARLRLKAEMLSTLTFHADGAVAVAELSSQAFERAQAERADSEELVNEPMEVGQVCVSVLMSDSDTAEIRVNFRSKSPEVCGRDVDVSAIARTFGGGGHRRAAGARLAGTMAEVRERVTAAVVAALE